MLVDMKITVEYLPIGGQTANPEPVGFGFRVADGFDPDIEDLTSLFREGLTAMIEEERGRRRGPFDNPLRLSDLFAEHAPPA